MSASKDAQLGQSGQRNQQNDAIEHQQPPHTLERPAQDVQSGPSSGDVRGGNEDGGAGAIEHRRDGRAHDGALDTDEGPRASNIVGPAETPGTRSADWDDDLDTLVDFGSEGDPEEPSYYSSSEMGAEDRRQLPSRPSHTGITHDRGRHDDSARTSPTLVNDPLDWDLSPGHGTDSAPEEWDDDDEDDSPGHTAGEGEDGEDEDWVRNPRVIPAAGVPLSEPAIEQVTYAMRDLGFFSLHVQRVSQLNIRYAPGPSRRIVHVSHRDPARSSINFVFDCPYASDTFMGVVGLTTEGLRTVIVAMQTLSLRGARDAAPSPRHLRQRVARWTGEWAYRGVSNWDDSSGRMEVNGFWSFVDPWSPQGARNMLELIQDARRLGPSPRVIFVASVPQRDSAGFPDVTLHVYPL